MINMKNAIMYYYNLNNITIFKKKNRVVIKYKNKLYEFIKVYNLKEVQLQNEVSKSNKKYEQIILNKDKKNITKYNNQNYVLIEKKEKIDDMLKEIINCQKIILNKSEYIKWSKLWADKCDYIESEYYNNIQGKYALIDESIDYYIGMTETAINYYNYNITEYLNNILYITHKRISYEDFYNPINIKIDYKERDYSEYLKMLFFTEKYKKVDLKLIITQYNLQKEQSIRLISRLMYPSYYYDLYEKIITKSASEKEIRKILERIDEYEEYIKKIYILINKNIDLPNIDWI